jgi:hypothetical protein
MHEHLTSVILNKNLGTCAELRVVSIPTKRRESFPPSFDTEVLKEISNLDPQNDIIFTIFFPTSSPLLKKFRDFRTFLKLPFS